MISSSYYECLFEGAIFVRMNKIVIVGCGYLADVVADALLNGILPEYELVGVYSRTTAKAERLASRMTQQVSRQRMYSLNDLLELKPDYLVEAASPAAMKEITYQR